MILDNPESEITVIRKTFETRGKQHSALELRSTRISEVLGQLRGVMPYSFKERGGFTIHHNNGTLRTNAGMIVQTALEAERTTGVTEVLDQIDPVVTIGDPSDTATPREIAVIKNVTVGAHAIYGFTKEEMSVLSAYGDFTGIVSHRLYNDAYIRVHELRGGQTTQTPF